MADKTLPARGLSMNDPDRVVVVFVIIGMFVVGTVFLHETANLFRSVSAAWGRL